MTETFDPVAITGFISAHLATFIVVLTIASNIATILTFATVLRGK